ncbi:hypothetical protein EYR40_010059 [Pleurotus pulmonarius]|nr:hypothetical protein EYR36_010544 [Pleurotus pulmonarius]KAF4588507.1 hypothetical protein EYR40_010059 [Pleurotus pulmonarius]
MVKRKVAAAKSAEGVTRPAKRQRASTKSDASSKEDESDAALLKLAASLKDALDAAKSVTRVSGSGIATLRRARALAASVAKALPEDPVVKQLDFDGHKKSINAVMKRLSSSCKRDWHDGWEIQWEYMGKLCGEIAEWMPDIWNAMQNGGDLRLPRACIVFCADTIAEIWSCESRSEFGHQSADVSIANEAGEVVYESYRHISNAMTWMWKELLIFDATPKAKPLSSPIMEDLRRYDETEGVFALLAGTILDEDDGSDLLDQHWTSGMYATAKKLILQRQNARVEQFTNEPTLDVYTKIVTESLKPSLIKHVRQDLAQRFPKIPLGDAVEIFKRNGLVDDIVLLIPKIGDRRTLCSIVKILSDARAKHKEKEKRKAYGIAALEILINGLTSARTNVMDEIESAFPALEDAENWLEDVVYEKYDPEVLQSDPKRVDNALARAISSIASQFVEKAAAGSSDNHWFGDHSDDDDSDGEGYKDEGARRPELSRPILDWLQALGEWPQKAEAEAVWDQVRWEDTKDPFGVNGILSAMSYHCEERKWYLTEGIRTLLKVYTCKDMAALEKYIPKTTAQRGSMISITSYPTFF